MTKNQQKFLSITQGGVINVLSCLKMYDYRLFSHSIRVGIISYNVTKEMGLPEEECRDALIAGLVHDFGKTVLPIEVVNAPRKLSDKEINLVHSHVKKGVKLLINSGCAVFSDSVITAVSQHHENVDGTGYPAGIEGISMLGKILRVCDAYDALTHDRLYKKAYNLHDSFAILHAYSATQFDGRVVEVLEEIVKNNDFAITDMCNEYFEYLRSKHSIGSVV